jgi:hypothetical protein
MAAGHLARHLPLDRALPAELAEHVVGLEPLLQLVEERPDLARTAGRHASSTMGG